MRALVGPGRAPYRYITNEYAPPEGDDVGFSDPIVPDLSDPATLGCLLALVRIAYGDPSFVVRCVAGLWYEESNTRALVARGGDTEAEALVAALEAAP